MAKGELYSIYTKDDEYLCQKVDEDFSPTGSYNVSVRGNRMFCSCYAGYKNTCRHRKMVEMFTSHAMVDSHKFYDYDHSKWVEVSVIVGEEND